MAGRGRALDNIFIERLWRTVKYEEVYLKDYETPREAMQGLATFFVRDNEWRQHQALGYQTPASVYFGSSLEQSILILALFCLDDGVRFNMGTRHPTQLDQCRLVYLPLLSQASQPSPRPHPVRRVTQHHGATAVLLCHVAGLRCVDHGPVAHGVLRGNLRGNLRALATWNTHCVLWCMGRSKTSSQSVSALVKDGGGGG
jgi:putative transposase